jgi:hypothetical protein
VPVAIREGHGEVSFRAGIVPPALT